jgi:hypothetical protein
MRPRLASAPVKETDMATASTNPQTEQSGQQSNQGFGQAVGSPITNEAYNLITALQSKLEGLEAYRKYAKDGDQELWAKLTQSETESVGILVEQLEQMVSEGRFRMH